MGEYYINIDSQHQKNEKVHSIWGWDFIVEMVLNGEKVGKLKKYVQFVAILHLLKYGIPMIDFEHIKG